MRNRKETISHFERNHLVREGKKYRYYFFDYLYYRLYVVYRKYNEPARFSACGVLCMVSVIVLFFFSICSPLIFFACECSPQYEFLICAVLCCRCGFLCLSSLHVSVLFLFLLIIRRPPSSTLLPQTTLLRSSSNS